MRDNFSRMVLFNAPAPMVLTQLPAVLEPADTPVAPAGATASTPARPTAHKTVAKPAARRWFTRFGFATNA